MILVTGGTGFVGAHLLYYLSLENDTVRAIYRNEKKIERAKKVFQLYTKNYKPLFNKIEWVKADITNIVALEDAFFSVTQVYHAAALVSFNPADYKKMRKVNIEGTANIANLCIEKQIEKICFFSSIATLDVVNGNSHINEEGEWSLEKNNYGYPITKYGAEMEIWRATQEGIPAIIVNPGVILGSGFWNYGTGELFKKASTGFPFYSEGITGFVSVKDVVNASIQLMNSTIVNQKFILVSENKSFKEVLSLMTKGFNKKPPHIKISKFLSWMAWRLEAIRVIFTKSAPLITKQTANSLHNTSFYTNEKIKQAIHFKFQPISECVTETCSDYKNWN